MNIPIPSIPPPATLLAYNQIIPWFNNMITRGLNNANTFLNRSKKLKKLRKRVVNSQLMTQVHLV